jgi:hypothetical protein
MNLHLNKSRVAFDHTRRAALVAGIFYIVTFVSSIPAVFLLAPVLNDPYYIIGAGADAQVIFGTLLDLVNALACIGTAVALFWVVKHQNESLALGFVTTRLFEAAVIVIGVVSLLAVVTLRQTALAGSDTATLVIVGQSLVALRNWTFIIGPGLMPAFNALLLGTLMYQSRLVPRIIPALGLIGAPLLILSTIGTMFGVNNAGTIWTAAATVPIFLWELSVGLWMIFRGFNRSAPLMATIALEKESKTGGHS